jgi:phosphoribosylformylglycinamidine synthase subunit PurS
MSRNRGTLACFKATAQGAGSIFAHGEPRLELDCTGAPERRSRTVRGVPRFVVDVMLKPEIHDPQGEAIASACRRLGFGQVAGVRQGKRFEIELSEPASPERISELAAELLANPVIEEFSVRPV